MSCRALYCETSYDHHRTDMDAFLGSHADTILRRVSVQPHVVSQHQLYEMCVSEWLSCNASGPVPPMAEMLGCLFSRYPLTEIEGGVYVRHKETALQGKARTESGGLLFVGLVCRPQKYKYAEEPQERRQGGKGERPAPEKQQKRRSRVSVQSLRDREREADKLRDMESERLARKGDGASAPVAKKAPAPKPRQSRPHPNSEQAREAMCDAIETAVHAFVGWLGGVTMLQFSDWVTYQAKKSGCRASAIPQSLVSSLLARLRRKRYYTTKSGYVLPLGVGIGKVRMGRASATAASLCSTFVDTFGGCVMARVLRAKGYVPGQGMAEDKFSSLIQPMLSRHFRPFYPSIEE
ncbi:hypothetical protein KIPB_006123, partial [Kipferlia bialata]|eukprot:g6123.t1